MPKSQEILDTLHSIANNYSGFAIFWHVIFYAVIAFLITAWSPSNKLFAIILGIPLLSVAIFAWLSGNPFNGTLFLVLALLVFIFGFRASPDPLVLSSLPFLITGIILVVFGLVYPHFLNAGSPLEYAYASPAGLIPCPTLSIVIGFALIFNGFGSTSVTILLVIFGLFYGLFGVLKLGVLLDLFLLTGSITLLLKFFTMVRNPI